jgi:hypothetical protein
MLDFRAWERSRLIERSRRINAHETVIEGFPTIVDHLNACSESYCFHILGEEGKVNSSSLILDNNILI